MKINLSKIFLILGVISFLLVPFIAGEYDSYVYSKKPICNLKKIDLDEITPKNLTTTKEGVTYTLTKEYFKSLPSYKKAEEYNNRIDEAGCLKGEYSKELSNQVREEFNQLPFFTKYKLNLGSSIIYWYFWIIPIAFFILAWKTNKSKKKNEN